MDILRFIIILLIAIVLFYENGYSMKLQPYNTVIRNIGKHDFSHSKFVFDKRVLSAGWVTAGNYKVNVNPSAPIPDKAIISWQREDGKIYKKEVEIKNKLSVLASKQEYYFVANIDDNNDVDFKVVICSQEEKCLDKW